MSLEIEDNSKYSREKLRARFGEVLEEISPILDAQQTWPMLTQALYHLPVKGIFGFKTRTGINFVERYARHAGVLITEKRFGTRLNPSNKGIVTHFLDKNGVKALALICALVGPDLTTLSDNSEYWGNVAVTIHQTLDPEDPLRKHIHIPQEGHTQTLA